MIARNRTVLLQPLHEGISRAICSALTVFDLPQILQRKETMLLGSEVTTSVSTSGALVSDVAALANTLPSLCLKWASWIDIEISGSGCDGRRPESGKRYRRRDSKPISVFGA